MKRKKVRRKEGKKLDKKEAKGYICPKCKSNNVNKVFRLRNFFGLYPRFKCNSCNHEEVIFPLLKAGKKGRKR